MNVYRNPDSLPLFRHAVITIGAFDGVHIGHQKIIRQLLEEAVKTGGESVIITFHPHPRKIVGSSREIKLINTLEEKIELLDQAGINQLVIVPFTETFSQLSAEQYVRDFLIRKFHPRTIITGYDHHFGKDRTGDYHLLEKLSTRYAYTLREIPVHVLNEISVSSTRIREAVAMGDIATANQLLGYDFFFDGKVIQGDRLGRTIGYPTANLLVEDPEKLLPADGVYAVSAQLAGGTQQQSGGVRYQIPKNTHPLHKAMMNIGYRPTVNGSRKMTEVNIFDFDQDIYGKTLRVYLKKYLRSEIKFSGLDALQAQLAKDREAAENEPMHE
jgi:riboflavin kinase/FMN adenylyltransferase